MTTHHFYSAKGGQGCTTSMVLEAATTQGRILLVDATENRELNAVLGTFVPPYPDEQINEFDSQTFFCWWKFGDQPLWRETDFDEILIDWGTQYPNAINRGDERVLVTRNCYLAIRAACKQDVPKPDRIVIVAEPGRALDENDIHRALDVNTINTIHIDPCIARSVDAGFLYQRNRRKFS